MPLWLVPRKKPAPIVCFWRSTPEKGKALPPAGGVTEPLKSPVDLATFKVRRLVLLFTIVLGGVSCTLLTKSTESRSLVKPKVPSVRLITAFVPTGMRYRHPTKVVTLVNPPGQ